MTDTTNLETKPPTVVLRGGADGRLLVVTETGAIPVRLRQCFPWSEPRRHLSLRDDRDREIALVDDPARLDPTSRAALEAAVAVAGFVLEVTRVLDVEEEVEIRQWTVDTTSGRRTFQTHLDDWPRVLPDTGGAIVIRDVAGDLYRLPPSGQLDGRSRALLWAFVD